ncbi:FAD-dependent thymidylate synthase [Murdochiella vaginalis]|uniref:FAD-dependent thymidylate synthase n=1 Tax=Murdochiella vaginalis TaxID=1852373 RepID=UPI0008FE3983|nr:FAD-dependent thymidylate synthase [Murdochiella vaginalis]
MQIIPPSIEILGNPDPRQMLRNMEAAGRVCYKSEANIKENTAGPFLRRLVQSGHESVIEHEKLSVKIICDRGVTHEIVRHRIASYSQESTRYCNYTKDKFGNELTFIKPLFWNEGDTCYTLWKEQMASIEKGYFALIEAGATPEEARSILPNSLKTEIVVTMNMREWRHFLRLRGSKAAHPQIREIVRLLLPKFRELLPDLFEDITID